MSMILRSKGMRKSAETAIDDSVPTQMPKITIAQKFCISPVVKKITGRIARIVVKDVPIVLGRVEFTA